MTENDLYFKWLCKLIRTNEAENRVENYIEVLNFLFCSPFIFVIVLDENRFNDGLSLRSRFIEEEKVEIPIFLRDCSVLEMLIALAERMGFNIMNITEEIPPTAFCFWLMIDNLGLNPKDLEKNKSKIDVLLKRLFARNGQGGLFPLEKPNRDQRKVEIWYQMMSYINQFSIEGDT